MKFTTSFSIAVFALAKFIMADSQTFGLVSINSGTDLQYASVFVNDGKLVLGHPTGSDLNGTITDAGLLKFSDGKYAVIESDGVMSEGSDTNASKGFEIKDGRLTYIGSSS